MLFVYLVLSSFYIFSNSVRLTVLDYIGFLPRQEVQNLLNAKKEQIIQNRDTSPTEMQPEGATSCRLAYPEL